MSRNILQHINESKQTFAKKLLHQIQNVQGQSYLIDLGFLDPAEQKICEDLANTYKVAIIHDELTLGCERKHVAIGVGVIEPAIILKGKYNPKFNQVEHRHVMGTLINSELDFKMIGDIYIGQAHFEILLLPEIKATIMGQFCEFNKAKITYQEVEQITIEQPKLEQTTIIVSSMRLDNVVKAVVKQARQKSQKLIKNKVVKVNYETIVNPNYEVKVADLIAIQKFGRRKIISQEQIRSGKYRLVIE